MQQDWKLLGTYGTVGLELALSILFGFFVGRWVDGQLGVSPVFTVLGFGFGTAAGIRALIRVVRQAQREMEKLDERERNSRQRYHDGGGRGRD